MNKEQYIKHIEIVMNSPRNDSQKINCLASGFEQYVNDVVRELEEELQCHVKGELHCEEKGYESGADRHRQKVVAYDTAIEIVKRGGRNG